MSAIKIKLKSNIFEFIAQKLLNLLFSAFIGFILSKTGIKSSVSPFSIPYLSITPLTNLSVAATYLGIIFGYIFNDFSILNFRYICANTIILLLIYTPGKKFYCKKLYSPVLSFAISLITGVFFIVIDGFEIFDILLILFESILSGCASFFIKYFIDAIKQKTRMDTKDIISFNITIIILLCAVDNYYVMSFSISVIMLQLVVFLCAYLFERKLALCFTVSLCTVMSALRLSQDFSFIIYFLPAFLTIILSKIDKKYIVPVYFISYSTILCFRGVNLLTLSNISHPLFAGVLFSVLPKKRIAMFLNKYIETQVSENIDIDKNQVCIKFCKESRELGKKLTDIKECSIIDKQSKNKLIKYLKSKGCEDIDILNNASSTNKQELDMIFLNKNSISKNDISKKLTNLTGMDFRISEDKSEGDVYCLKFEQYSKYKVECFAIFKAKKGEKICGDNIAAFKTNDNAFHIMLADGMGSGKDAYSKSLDTINILKKLLKSGIDPISAIKTTNSSINIIKDEIGFSTLDLCSVSLKNGFTEFYKCGGYVSYILRNGSLIEIKENGFPVGLNDNVFIEKQDIILNEGDIIIMMSDGVSNVVKKIQSILLISKGKNIETLCRELMDTAYNNTPKEYDDDMTVIVSKFSKNI